MKLKNLFLPAMLFAGVMTFSSCERSEQDTMEPTFEQGTIAQVLMDSSEVTSYNYIGSSVSQINYYNQETGEFDTFEKFVMDASNRLIKSSIHSAKSHAVLSEQTYNYDSKGLLANTSSSYMNAGKIEYSAFATYEYDADKKLKKKSVYEGDLNNKQLKSYTRYEVLPNGNYSQEKQFVIDDEGSAKLFSTTTFSYDSNTNPFFNVAEPGKASSPNNVIASSSVVHGSKKTYSYSYTYKYDERGYPTSQSVVSPSGKQEKFTFLYSN